jgi:two-component system phosphate regulon sensor histidine kinase PhoR
MVVAFFVYTLFVILQQRRLSEIQKDFINNMTHEFKTPLSTIAISSGVLKDPSIAGNPSRLLQYATIIENENKRLKQHVERVLQVASLDRKDIGLKKESVVIDNLIEEAVRNISLSLQEKQGHIHLDLKAGEVPMMADPLHITNVLFNLLDNAIKYSSHQPEISISTSSDKRQLRIEIKDNGYGISSEHQKKVFDRFYRIPTGNVHDIKGFGLGLNYVKLVVEAHGGKIELTSTPQKGSTFILTIPHS